LQAQRLESAISSYSAALRIKPDSAELYFHRGVAWSNTFYNRGRNGDDLQKAIDDYSRGIELDQKYGEAYFSRAGLLSEQGQVAEAIEDYNKTIENGHQVSHSYYCRAHLWKSTGQAAKAIADFDEAIRTGDRNNQYISLMARGEVHCNLGNLELAVADLTAAAAYYPNDPSPGLYTHRAAALRQLGRTREAISDLDQAIAALSSLAGAGFVADIYDQRGQCRMQLGELDSSVEVPSMSESFEQHFRITHHASSIDFKRFALHLLIESSNKVRKVGPKLRPLLPTCVPSAGPLTAARSACAASLFLAGNILVRNGFNPLVNCVKLLERFRVRREVFHEQFDREILSAPPSIGIVGDPASRNHHVVSKDLGKVFEK
jgi:tetratricopeptide (TPR) repeat protein